MKTVAVVAAALGALAAAAAPEPSPAHRIRLDAEEDIIGIVHWGLNTFTDREWGYGDEDPAMLDPARFDADQIVGACRDGGIRGLVVVAKHHDGFCLWPTKTTEHNITKSPFRGGKGDYVREMCDACRRAGLKFGVYCSPWDRNSAHYATEKYVEIYHAQVRELLDGRYGEIFEMWFDGANGGDGWYGGAKEKRKIPEGYYRFGEILRFVRELQPKVAVFSGEFGAEYRWPGNERGDVDPVRSAFRDGGYSQWEADFPLRPGWFYHASERGRTKHAAYLMNRYLSSVGNGGWTTRTSARSGASRRSRTRSTRIRRKTAKSSTSSRRRTSSASSASTFRPTAPSAASGTWWTRSSSSWCARPPPTRARPTPRSG